MSPSPALLNALRRSRFNLRHAVASQGVGERRSKQKGSGMEFADFRDYQPGDDVRHLDPHLHARHGGYFVRQYSVDRQVPVTIVLDASASMDFGAPNKFAFARDLAAALAFVGLSGGDVVQIVACRDGRTHMSSRIHGASRAPILFGWLDELSPSGKGFGETLQSVRQHLPARGLTFLISDFWFENPESDLKSLGSANQEFVALHIATAEELNPAAMSTGETRLVDAETGHEVELQIDDAALERYGRAFAAWRERLREQFSRLQGRYILLRADQRLDDVLLRDWRRLGLIS